ncbi:hypothetical protein CDD83_2062 [Cordyceps sp. RAO-2017]|nr:hypothetical protein CDD83_2062 [Cordyceps sp. RAO-2017]
MPSASPPLRSVWSLGKFRLRGARSVLQAAATADAPSKRDIYTASARRSAPDVGRGWEETCRGVVSLQGRMPAETPPPSPSLPSHGTARAAFSPKEEFLGSGRFVGPTSPVPVRGHMPYHHTRPNHIVATGMSRV